MYEDFAGVYDALMDDYDYDAWAAHYLTLMRDAQGALPARAAECACGTGSLTVRLAREGIDMVGVDLSRSMLRHAEEKARQWGVQPTFVCQDMRRLTLPRRVGAVLATCDGVNYLTGEADVRAFFRAAYAALLPGGCLCFDCSSRHKLEDEMGTAFFGEERDGIATLWQNRLSPETHVVTLDVTFFVREDDGRYRRFRETHRQRAHSEAELLGWLREAGFEDCRAFGGMRLNAPRLDDQRIHYQARKRAVPAPTSE